MCADVASTPIRLWSVEHKRLELNLKSIPNRCNDSEMECVSG